MIAKSARVVRESLNNYTREGWARRGSHPAGWLRALPIGERVGHTTSGFVGLDICKV